MSELFGIIALMTAGVVLTILGIYSLVKKKQFQNLTRRFLIGAVLLGLGVVLIVIAVLLFLAMIAAGLFFLKGMAWIFSGAAPLAGR